MKTYVLALRKTTFLPTARVMSEPSLEISSPPMESVNSFLNRIHKVKKWRISKDVLEPQ